AAPFALFAALGLLHVRRPQLEASVELTGDRALEGDEIGLQVQLRADAGAERVELLLELPRELVVEDGDNPMLLRLRDGERRDLALRVQCTRWGAFRVGRIYIRASDAFGLFRHETVLDRRVPLK